MVQKASHTHSTRQNSKFKNIDITCSCTKCDSMYCFSKRYIEDSCSCSCNNCKESKTCLFFTNRLVRVKRSHSDATNAAPISTIPTATGDNVYSKSAYTSFYKVSPTKSYEAVMTSKQSSSNLDITNKHSSKSVAITDKKSSKILPITNKSSKTLAITNKQSAEMLGIINNAPSKMLAITHKKPAALTNKFIGQRIIVAYETGVQSKFTSQKKPFDRSQNSIKKEDSAFKSSSCCIEPAIPKPESRSCGHHRSAESYKAPEQLGCLSRDSYQPSSPGYVIDLSNYKTTKSKTNTCKDRCKANITTSAKDTKDDICNESVAECKPAELAPDSPGFIIDLKKLKYKTPCCNDSSKPVSNAGHDPSHSRGYVVDISGCSFRQSRNPLETCKNIFASQINAIKALCTTCRLQRNRKTLNDGKTINEGLSKMCACKTPDQAGYIIDLNNKKPCDCNQSQEKQEKPEKKLTPFYNKEDNSQAEKPVSERKKRGYVFDIPKPYNIIQDKRCCKCNQPKLESNPPGYLYDLKTHCDCNTPKLVSDPPGHVYNYTQRIKLQRKTTCNCEILPQNNLSYPPGFVVVVEGNSSKDRSKQQASSISVSSCCKPTKNILSFWPGKAKKHTFKNEKNPCSCNGLPQDRPQESRDCGLKLDQFISGSENKPYCSVFKLSKPISASQQSCAYRLELCKNILKIQRNAIETLDNLCLLEKNCCNCLSNQIGRHESNAKQFLTNKAASIKQQLCQNILETQLNAVGILHDVTCVAQDSAFSYPCNKQDNIRLQNYKQLLTNKTSCNKCTHSSENINRQKFFINFVKTSRTGSDTLGSSYKKDTCECGVKNSPGYVLELVGQKEDSANKTDQKKKCDCEQSRKRLSNSAGYIIDLDQYKNESINKPRKLSKNISEQQKNATETLKNECGQKNCECRKKMSSSTGYILDLNQMRKSQKNNVVDVQRHTIESLSNTNQKKKCKCSENHKSSPETDGYIIDLQQNSNLSKNASQGYTIEPRTNTSCHKCCVCKKPSKVTSETSGYILELSQYKEKNATESFNKKNNCKCSEGHKKPSETAGCIVDLGHLKQELPTKTHKLSKNIFGIQKGTIELKKSCGCSVICNKQSSSEAKSLSRGYVMELDQYKKSCACRKSSQMTSEPPGGYTVDLSQYKQNQGQDQNKTCKCNQDKKQSDSFIGRQLSNTLKTGGRNTSEIKTNCQTNCDCQKPSKTTSEPPGYILELDQYKKEQGKNQGDSCNCDQGKKKSSGSATQLSNIPKNLSKTSTEIKTNTNCHKSCVCKKPSKLISDPPGYILELDQYKKEQGKSQGDSCNCGQGKKTPPSSATQLSNKPKDLSKTSTEIKTNTKCCACPKPSKHASEPPGYILELDQYKKKQEKSQGDSCNCGQGKKTPPSSATQLSNKPKDLSKTSTEIKTNTNCHKSCVCKKPSKLISDPPGYILELDQYKKEQGKSQGDSCNCGQGKKTPPSSATQLSNKPKDLSKTSTEIKTNTNCHKSCVCKKPSKLISDPPGYILELDQYKKEQGKSQGDSCNCGQGKKTPPSSATQLSNKPKDLSKTSTEIKTNTNCHKSCVCKKPSKLISDPPGYILELDQYKKEQGKSQGDSCKCGQGKKTPPSSATQLSNKPKDLSKTSTEIKTNTKCCACPKPSKHASEPPGYILELDQYKKKQGKSQGDSCNCGQGKKTPPSSATQLSNKPKDLSKTSTEIKTNTNCHKSCVCKKPSKLISDPPGYILELDQYKKEQGKSQGDSCKCGQGKKTPPSSATQLSNKPKDLSKTSTEIKTNTNCHKSCVCKKPSKLISDPPGYILELDQYKKEQGKSQGDSCNCGQGKKTPPSSATQLSNKPKDLSKTSTEIKTNTNCHKSCVCKKPSKLISDPPGYILELDQYKKEQGKSQGDSCKCGQGKKTPPSSATQLSNKPKDLSKTSTEIKTNTNCHKSCVCKKPSKLISDPPGYILELDQYKKEQGKSQGDSCKCGQGKKTPPSSATQLSNKPKDLSKTSTEIKTNTSCQKCCACPKPSKLTSEPPGYILELDQYKQDRARNKDKKCKCSDPNKKMSELSGYIVDLQEYKQKPTNKAHVISKNIFEVQRNTIETQIKGDQKKKCTCGDSQNRSSRGYVLDLQQYRQTQPKNNCSCNDHESAKKRSNSAGYIVDLKQYKQKARENTQSETCHCKKSNMKTFEPITCCVGDTELKENKIKTPTNTATMSNSTCNCQVSEPSRSNFKKIPGPTKNALEVCKNIYGLQLDYKKSENDDEMCNCNQTQTNKIDIPKFTKVSLNDTKETCNCEQTSPCKFGLPDLLIALHKRVPTDTIIEMCKTILDNDKQDNRTLANETPGSSHMNQDESCMCDGKTDITAHTQENKRLDLCDPRVISKTIEKLKKIYLPSTKAQKNSYGICDPVEMSSAIEKLKKIYLPSTKAQKNSSGICDPVEMSSAIEKLKKVYLPQGNTQKSSPDLCNPVEISKTLENLNTVYLPATKTQKHTSSINKPLESLIAIEKLKKDYLPQSDTQKNSSEFCDQVEMSKTIEKLKKVYLPQANTQNKTSDLCDQVKISKAIEKLKTIYLPQTRTQKSTGLCDPLEASKIIEKLKMFYLPPTKTQKTTFGFRDPLEKLNTIDKGENFNFPASSTTKDRELNTQTPYKQASSEIQKLKNTYLPPRYTLDYPKTYEHSATEDQPVHCHTEAAGTAKWSAQVMDSPCTDFQNSSSHKQENICGKAHKLTKHEIFKRIQEAYKACSCKVCECIIGNSSFSKQSKDICNCKPCECNDCISYLDKMNHEPPAKQLSTTHEGNCSCIRCDKRHCKGVDQQQTCDCKPCDCVKCTHLTQPCDCDPCQCVVCQRRKKLHKQRTLVVAPVGQSVQRVSCTCSPCECIECGGFPATSRVTNETSTATNRHAQCRCEICLNEHCENSAVNFCRCESQKGVINKPVAKGSHDYDIRTASVVLKRQKIKDKIKLSSRHDTVAMFAAVPYAFPTHSAKSIPSVTKTYSCEKCECVSCDCKENGINSNKPSQLFTLNNLPTLSKHAINSHFKTNSPQNYNCANFENKTCDDSLEQKTNCMSNVCDCINCAEESKVTKYTLNDSKGQCIDNEIKIISGMGHTYQCSKYIYEESYRDDCRSNQIVHPIQRGEILSPTSHRSEVKNQKFEKQCHETPIHSNECETLNCNTSMPCQEMNRTNPLPINNYTDIKISGSSFSGYSSLETSPKTSCHIGFGGVAPFLQSKNKSWESSCNSSGHDYPDYLIQFPKSTVETCLKDVMKLNMDRTITIDKFNIIPKKGSVQYQANSMSNELMSGVDYILTPSHGSNIMNSCDCKTVTAKCTESINQYHDVLDCNHYAYTPWDTDVVESTSCNCKFEIQKSNRPGNFENVQTSELSHHNYSECIEDNTSITVTECETKTETRKCFHILQKFSDVHVACKMLQCNPSEHKSANNLFQIENEEYYTRKSSNPISEGIFVGDVETSNNDEIYTRVQKSLKEAKEYSAQLKQLLDMYEKANKEFESVTDKLKIPQVSVSKDAVLEENEIQKMFVKEEGFIEIEHELQERPLEARSVKEVLTCSSILQESIKPEKTFAECENNFNTISEKMGQTELITSSDYETCNLSIGECDPKNKLNTANENQTFVGNETALINEIDNNSNNSLYPNKSIDAEPRDKDSIHDIKSLSTDYQRIRKKDRTNAKHYRKYSKLLKRTIIISKRISLNNSNLNTSPNTIVKYCVTEGTSAVELNTNVNNDKNHSIPVKNYSDKESSDSSEDECVRKYRENVILKKLNSVFGSEEVSVSASTDTYGIERDILSLNESGNSLMAQEFEEAKPWPILKKNYFSSKQNAKNNGVCIFPSLELQIKQAVQSISLQTSSTFTSTNKSVAYHANKALEQLQDEVKKLLDTPILQPQTASICGYNTKESFNVQPENKLELELNETPEESVPSTLKDVESVDKEARCSFTREAVESLIKDLHDLSMTRSFETGTEVLQKTTVVNEKNDNTPKIITPKCSCEALKVGFLYVRRVSDHTVLVKWNVPRKLDKVHGYELLVDGRAVQKIFSPTKSMAVVTCLPHTDKVLLTIRTITSSVFVTGHYPATTIIYQPRVK